MFDDLTTPVFERVIGLIAAVEFDRSENDPLSYDEVRRRGVLVLNAAAGLPPDADYGRECVGQPDGETFLSVYNRMKKGEAL